MLLLGFAGATTVFVISFFTNFRRCLSLLAAPAVLRGVLSFVLIVGYLGTILGYPQFRPVANNRLAEEPYPCQFSKCGCQTREKCRTNCCCHTKAEKIAWAQVRGIDPNHVAVLTPEEQKQIAAGEKKFVVRPVKSKTRPCCAKHSAPEAKQTESKLVFILSIDAQKCQGTGVEWIQAGFVALPPPAVSISITQPETSLPLLATGDYLPPTFGRLVPPG